MLVPSILQFVLLALRASIASYKQHAFCFCYYTVHHNRPSRYTLCSRFYFVFVSTSAPNRLNLAGSLIIFISQRVDQPSVDRGGLHHEKIQSDRRYCSHHFEQLRG